jgi:hypothetical protein
VSLGAVSLAEIGDACPASYAYLAWNARRQVEQGRVGGRSEAPNLGVHVDSELRYDFPWVNLFAELSDPYERLGTAELDPVFAHQAMRPERCVLQVR